MGKKIELGRTVILPCHVQEVTVTKRKSKQAERPRLHKCKKCNKEFQINAATGKILD